VAAEVENEAVPATPRGVALGFVQASSPPPTSHVEKNSSGRSRLRRKLRKVRRSGQLDAGAELLAASLMSTGGSETYALRGCGL
jgi:hypothetical protein